MKNIAVVGTGYWGKNLVRNFHTLEVLHTVCDVNRETVRSFCDQYPGVQGVISFSEVLSNLLRVKIHCSTKFNVVATARYFSIFFSISPKV